ncbi:hypothetical protein GW750_04130 [bacterium]|nr:hypothetical protein [bacterium]
MKQQNQAIVEQYTQTLNKNFREYNQIPLDIPDAKLPIGRQYTAIHQLEKESMYIKDYDSIPTDLYEVKTMKKLLNQDNISQLVSKASDKQKFDFTIYGLTHYASLSHKQKLVFDAIVGETMIYMTKA